MYHFKYSLITLIVVIAIHNSAIQQTTALRSGARSSSSSSNGPRSRSRSNHQRHRDSQLCHLKEIDSCLDKIQTLTKGPNPSAIITTSDGLNKLCG
ncbi:hypothetical protein BLA29_013003 [Euroglyphus maynei]|uniref:Uncharacterized protein n=1 Tax=Euroglyphus maynei TaxID=6958 RepID=A0A1Y3BDS4_EURMA|nr:hypothetical protein BLA29_013003 [Euroglyphus maynei]